MFKKISEWIYRHFICEHYVVDMKEEETYTKDHVFYIERWMECRECRHRSDYALDFETANARRMK